MDTGIQPPERAEEGKMNEAQLRGMRELHRDVMDPVTPPKLAAMPEMVALLVHVRTVHGVAASEHVANGGSLAESDCATCGQLADDYRAAKNKTADLKTLTKINIKGAIDRAEEIGFRRGMEYAARCVEKIEWWHDGISCTADMAARIRTMAATGGAL
jgi:hypothetical protein